LVDAPEQPGSARIAAALERHEARSLKRLTVARTTLFLLLFCWLWLNYGWVATAPHGHVLLAFILVGLVAYALRRRRPQAVWIAYLAVLVDVALVTYTLLSPGRTYPPEWPWQTVLRQPSFIYTLLVLALATLSFRAGLVWLAGIAVTVAWTGTSLLILNLPDTIGTMADIAPGSSAASFLARYLEPRYVHVDDILVRMVVTLMLTAILAVGAAAARRLIFEQAAATRARTNLARYLAPGVVERLADTDTPMGPARLQEAAVLFCDIRGFTALAERLSPEATMALLRDFHGRMADLVFAHGGTLDKFIGDGLMATFGTLEPAADDAVRSIACARAMLRAVAAMDAARLGTDSPVAVGIGVHWGTVMVGDIGGANRFEFAVLGDAVNVASRLERLTRELGLTLLLSDALIARARAEGGVLDGLAPLAARRLRGRSAPIGLWTMATDAAAAD
jgi:adenylate cyclase